MANTTIATVEQSLTAGTSIAAGTGTALDASNTHIITPTGRLEDMVILVQNTEGSTNVITFAAGANPPASSSSLGSLALTLAATTGYQLMPVLESARFLKANGTVTFTLEAGTTGFCMAVQLKRR
jgi:hypothetical protein